MIGKKFAFATFISCILLCAGQSDLSLKNAEIKDQEFKISPTNMSIATDTIISTSTTIAPPKPTTPAPAPFPDPKVGTWNVSCIMIKMAAQLNFTYETKDGTNATALYNMPNDAEVENHSCMDQTQMIQINWGPLEAQHSMTMQFDKINNTVLMRQIRFILPLLNADFPNAKENITLSLVHLGSDFSTPSKMSYHCTRGQKLNLYETVMRNDTLIGYVTLRDVQVEAFRTDAAAGFSDVHDCDATYTSDIVPIAVGIALVVLILIVLVSYLCARRRSQSGGYVSF